MKRYQSHLAVALVGLLASAAAAHAQHRGGSGSHGGSSGGHSGGHSGSGHAAKSGPGRTPPGKISPGKHPPAVQNHGTKPNQGVAGKKPTPGAGGKNTKPNPTNLTGKKPTKPGANGTGTKPGKNPSKNPAGNKTPKLNVNARSQVSSLVDKISPRLTDAILLAGLARLAEGIALSPAHAQCVGGFLDNPGDLLAADDVAFLQSCVDVVGTEDDDDGSI